MRNKTKSRRIELLKVLSERHPMRRRGISAQRLAIDLGYHRNTVLSMLNELEQSGCIRLTRASAGVSYDIELLDEAKKALELGSLN